MDILIKYNWHTSDIIAITMKANDFDKIYG